MARHQRRATDKPQPPPEPEPVTEPSADPESVAEPVAEPTPEPHRPDPPAAEVDMDALSIWAVKGSLRTATFPVTKLAVAHVHIGDPDRHLVPGTKVILRVELPDGACAVLGQAGSAAADTDTVTVTSVERGNPHLRQFLADRAS
jgi:hypothetical protein